jgi:XTP/dITP diphosphohydrolase
MELVFATNNKHKLEEIRSIIPASIKILSLADIGCTDELPETGNTLHQNSLQKAQYVFLKFGMNCFADDTGLEIDALDGRPGVYSARYAGPQCNFNDNINLVLTEMRNETNRNARFRTVISLIRRDEGRVSRDAARPSLFDPLINYFEGEIKGEITLSPIGTNGFGYDSVFIPNGDSITFAQMHSMQKNSISHRAEAVKKLADFLTKLKTENF